MISQVHRIELLEEERVSIPVHGWESSLPILCTQCGEKNTGKMIPVREKNLESGRIIGYKISSVCVQCANKIPDQIFYCYPYHSMIRD